MILANATPAECPRPQRERRRRTAYPVLIISAGMFLLASVFLSAGCDHAVSPAPTDSLALSGMPAYGLLGFDSRAGDGNVALHWTTGFSFDFPPLPADTIRFARLYMSRSGPDSGFRFVHESGPGAATAAVTGLTNGAMYYFRLTTHDGAGTLLGISAPLMTSPGIPDAPAFSLPVRLADSPEYYTGLSWSPTSRQLAFVQSVNGHPNLHVLDLSSGAAAAVTHYAADDYRLMSISWDPSGERLAYCYTPSRTYAELNYRIWVTTPSGAPTASVTSGTIDADPAWESPSSIIFCRGSVGSPNVPELYRVDLAAGNAETALTAGEVMRKYTPRLNAPRGFLAFSGETPWPARRSIYAVPPSGGAPSALVPNPYWIDAHPSFSPDGARTCFTSTRSGHREIWSYRDADGSFTQITRTQNPGSERHYGFVSPDGAAIAVIETTAGTLAGTLLILPGPSDALQP